MTNSTDNRLNHLIEEQRRAVAQLHDESAWNGEKVAHDAMRAFARVVDSFMVSFMWDVKDIVVMVLKSSASTAFDDAFERAVIWRFEAMSKELSALTNAPLPDIGRSELDATREGIALARECGIKIERALDKAKPGLLNTIFSPGLESDNWDSHQEAQREPAKQAIEDVYDDIEACMTKAARRLVDLAADEYSEGLRRLISRQENPADAATSAAESNLTAGGFASASIS